MLPYEIWEEIAFCEIPNALGIFNVLVRAIPKLGRKTLDFAFQDYVIERFKLYSFDKMNNRSLIMNGNLYSVYDRSSYICYIDGDKREYWHKNGEIHRDFDKPAVIGRVYKEWWRNGKLHRDGDKPARVWHTGTLSYWKNGKQHRDGGPALVGANGLREWRLNGKLIKEEIDK